MDLWCNEPHLREDQQNEETMTSTIHPEYIAAAADHVLMSDHRVLDKLLMTESRGMISEADIIYDSLDSEVRPKMRKILASWMLEVSTSQSLILITILTMNINHESMSQGLRGTAVRTHFSFGYELSGPIPLQNQSL